METKRFYSPNQVLLGSFLGGPIAATHFLRSNYLALGKSEEAQKTLRFGAIIILALLGILPFLPDTFPSIIIPLAYCFAAKQLAVSTQLGKEDIAEADNYRFASNWLVFGLGILTLLIFFVLIVASISIMEIAGIITLA